MLSGKNVQKSFFEQIKSLIAYGLYLGKVSKNIIIAPRGNCNLCGYTGPFRTYGHSPRYGVQCPSCGSLERHRLVKMWLDANQGLVKNKSFLHFAPESVIKKLVKSYVGDYKSADLHPGRADLVLNIEAIALPDNSVDIIMCSHVLEHVDDAKALAEFKRILRPDGLALVLIPLVEGWDKTYENPNVKTEAERIAHFGQNDHVRFYGRDVRERFAKAGFAYEEFTAVEPHVLNHRLLRGEKIFILRPKVTG
jgi:SAM-dependent methyltransferase